MSWTNLLQQTPTPRYESILQSLTLDEGLCFQEFCNHLRSRVSSGEIFSRTNPETGEPVTITTLSDCVQEGVGISLSSFVSNPLSIVTKENLGNLISIGLVFSRDGNNFGITQLGVEFLTHAESLP